MRRTNAKTQCEDPAPSGSLCPSCCTRTTGTVHQRRRLSENRPKASRARETVLLSSAPLTLCLPVTGIIRLMRSKVFFRRRAPSIGVPHILDLGLNKTEPFSRTGIVSSMDWPGSVHMPPCRTLYAP